MLASTWGNPGQIEAKGSLGQNNQVDNYTNNVFKALLLLPCRPNKLFKLIFDVEYIDQGPLDFHPLNYPSHTNLKLNYGLRTVAIHDTQRWSFIGALIISRLVWHYGGGGGGGGSQHPITLNNTTLLPNLKSSYKVL